MKAVLFASSLLTMLALRPDCFSAESPLLNSPVRPEVLLAALPQAGEAWTVVRSDAETTLGEGLQTRAVRIFRPAAVVATNSAESSGDGQTVPEVRIRLSDFAGRIPGDFANFKPGKAGAFESYLIGSYPAISFTRDRQRLVKVLLANRYVAELTFVDLPREKPETWLQGLHFEGLRDVQPVVIPPNQRDHLVRFVDELHPEKNRQYKVSTSAAHVPPPVDDEKTTK